MKILISGVPGTGKTILGNYLAQQKGFFHLNMEEDGFRPVRKLETDSQAFINDVSKHEKIVITWGFGPFMDRPLIEQLQQKGFQMFWLDGDRIASFRAYMHREKHNDRSEYNYYGQMREIVATEVATRLQATQLNPFDQNGEFRPVESIAEELLRAGGSDE